MEKSAEIKNLAIALCGFQSEMPILQLDKEVKVIPKSGKGNYSFKYATLSSIIEASKPILAKHKLSYSQLIEENGSVTTILMHESGEYLISNFYLTATDKNAQSLGSAITYNRRYSLAAMLGIIADDDDDGNASQGNGFEASKPKSFMDADKIKELTQVLLKCNNKDELELLVTTGWGDYKENKMFRKMCSDRMAKFKK
jgi:hypothetical protein